MSDTRSTRRSPGRLRRTYRTSLWATGLFMALVVVMAITTRDARSLLGLPGLAIAFVGLERSGAHQDAVRDMRPVDGEAEYIAQQAARAAHHRAELLWGLLALTGIALTLALPALLT